MEDRNGYLYLIGLVIVCAIIGNLRMSCSRATDTDPTVFDIGDGHYHKAYCTKVNEYNIDGSYDSPAEARRDGLTKHSCCPPESQYETESERRASSFWDDEDEEIVDNDVDDEDVDDEDVDDEDVDDEDVDDEEEYYDDWDDDF